ncbi:MAG: transposase [Verrucomicrobia bacterium]|nr:transposase [Verrucomicrobiota bacterium]
MSVETELQKHYAMLLRIGRETAQEIMRRAVERGLERRQLWLYNPEKLSPEQAADFSVLKNLQLKVARAWAAKKLFAKF